MPPGKLLAPDQIDLSSFYLMCFGLGDHGMNVEWSTESGTAWVDIHLDVYRSMLPELFRKNYPTRRLLGRLRRAEYRALDRDLLDAIIGLSNVANLLRDDTSSNLAELLIELAPLAKKDRTKRDQWRRFLAELELKGNWLAWQILAEVSDRI